MPFKTACWPLLSQSSFAQRYFAQVTDINVFHIELKYESNAELASSDEDLFLLSLETGKWLKTNTSCNCCHYIYNFLIQL